MSSNDFFACKLPLSLQKMALEVLEETRAPEAIILSSILGTISCACQRLINVEHPKDTNNSATSIPVSLYLLTIAKSGERKSSTDRLISKPLYDFDKKIAAEHAKYQSGFKAEKVMWDIKLKRAKKDYERALSNGTDDLNCYEVALSKLIDKEPQKTSPKKMVCNDATSAAFLRTMAGVSHSAILISSDSGNIFNRLNPDFLSNLNLLWDGDPITVDRVSQGSFEVTDGRLTTLLMIQPEILGQILKKKNHSIRTTGTFSRMLIAYPLSTQGYRATAHEFEQRKYTYVLQAPQNMYRYNQAPLPPPETPQQEKNPYLNQFYKRISTLLNQSWAREIEEPRLNLKFSPEAQNLWLSFANNVERHQKENYALADISDFASKIATNVARIAALLSYYEEGDATQEIHFKYVQMAVKLGDFYLSEFKILFGKKEESLLVIEQERSLLKWFAQQYKSSKLPEKFTQTYISTRVDPPFRKAATLQAVLRRLHQKGMIDYVEKPLPRTIQLNLNFFV